MEKEYDDLVGRKCNIHIRVKGVDLFYTGATILQADHLHIIFSDRFKELHMYKIEAVMEVSDFYKEKTNYKGKWSYR